MQQIKWEDLAPGDVLIQTGNPYGHAVTVMDVAQHPETGEKLYMLSQSYMPAQETQILRNPTSPDGSPWYSANSTTTKVQPPEWNFLKSDLRRFRE